MAVFPFFLLILVCNAAIAESIESISLDIKAASMEELQRMLERALAPLPATLSAPDADVKKSAIGFKAATTGRWSIIQIQSGGPTQALKRSVVALVATTAEGLQERDQVIAFKAEAAPFDLGE